VRSSYAGSRRVGELLKGVHGNDNVRKLLRLRYEETSILNSRAHRLLSCYLESVLAEINTDHAHGPSSSHVYGISSFDTALVDDNCPCNSVEDFIPH
jgi:hypothetical protein